MCPDGDLFAALGAGSASIVTDRIETFTERGLKLAGGVELEADVIVTATGLKLLALGGVELALDGAAVISPSHMVYKGMMLSGVPNFAMTIGYTNASWTLKCDLTSEYVCRLLNHMDRHGYRAGGGRPRRRLGQTRTADQPRLGLRPAVSRDFPTQGSKRPWRLYQNYALDVMTLRMGQLDDGVLRFSRGAAVGGRTPIRGRRLAGAFGSPVDCEPMTAVERQAPDGC